MAQYYKVDNRPLNEEEYNEHCVGLWAVCLFFATAIYSYTPIIMVGTVF